MKLKNNILIQKMGGTFVAYDNDTSTLHELNETAYLILVAIEKKKTKKQIVGEIVRNFKVSVEKANSDYDEFLKILENKELVVRKK